MSPLEQSFRPSFTPAQLVEHRLFARAQRISHALVRGLSAPTPATAAARRGAQRFFHNGRIDDEALLEHSRDAGAASLRDAPVILSAEDTLLARAGGDVVPKDAGRLRWADDWGYVVHCAFGVLPGTGKPHAWLGARVWTRGEVLRGQDHKARPPERRESIKWSALRGEVHAALRAAGALGRIISLNDSEGDAWSSIHDAAARGHELITRARQNRRILESERLKLKPYLRRRPVAATIELEVHSSQPGARAVRTARVEVRWARVHLRPPRGAPEGQREPVELVAVYLRERRPPRGVARFESWLLTTCRGVADVEAVLQVVSWYGERWGGEVGNDLLKNATRIEMPKVRDVKAFRRVLALSGPAAAHVARWVALARQPKPPRVTAVFERQMLADLRQACGYFGVPAPRAWTVPRVVETLARIGGADVRPNRPPGWRVVWRGWQRFDEYCRIRDHVQREATTRPPRPPPVPDD